MDGTINYVFIVVFQNFQNRFSTEILLSVALTCESIYLVAHEVRGIQSTLLACQYVPGNENFPKHFFSKSTLPAFFQNTDSVLASKICLFFQMHYCSQIK